MTAQEILEEYTGRWNIETTFEDSRAYLAKLSQVLLDGCRLVDGRAG
jgi:hypothetical protein